MNQQMYKLVFNKSLNMLVPVSEAAKSHSAKSGKKRIKRYTSKAAKFSLLISFSFAYNAYADGPPNVVPRNAQAWINANIAQATSNSITIRQSAARAIADWNKMNLGKGELLTFDQQGNRSWSILNRIYDSAPSMINGKVQADGNVYFINRNGIIFGADSQINVGSLYGGTLEVDQNLFLEDGLLSKPFKPVFEAVGEILPGSLEVEKGAQINTLTGGKVLLFAPDVKNSGVINTPEGQTILAAGKKVYLTSSADPAGFMVEVSSGGTATNLGQIVAKQGNVTMIGLAVNQSGTLQATTSVRANGSIKLLAGNTIDGEAALNTFPSSAAVKRDGKVTIATGSLTEVTPELADKEEIGLGQKLAPSNIEVAGSIVNLDGKINAKGGNVKISTLNNAPIDENDPTKTVFGDNILQRIYLGENASIDVSGVDAEAPMSRNQIAAELFSDQLKDAPILRGGKLFKETVYIDARKGTDLFDIAPFKDLTKVTLAERLTKAGSVSLDTTKDLIIREGSKIDVSGGSTTYKPGEIKETNLLYNGKNVPISQANNSVPYDSTSDVYYVTDKKWGVTRAWNLGGGTENWGDRVTGNPRQYLKTIVAGSQVAGYTQGDDAGTINFNNPQNFVNNGTQLANTKTSTQQLIKQQLPKGGEIEMAARDLTISQVAGNLAQGFKENTALENADSFSSQINADFLKNGFNRITLNSSDKKLKINTALELQANGSLTIGAAEINADIKAPGANIAIGGDSKIADNVKISTAGNFINDAAGAPAALTQIGAVNGGTITTNVNEVTSSLEIGKNVSFDASAGAYVDNTGKLHKGKAGDIQLGIKSQDSAVAYSAFGFDNGGKLSLNFIGDIQDSSNLNLNIAAADLPNQQNFNLSSDFFNQGGFSAYNLKARGDILIGNGSAQEIYASQKSWVIDSNFRNLESAEAMSQVARPVLLPEYARTGVSVALTTQASGQQRVDTLKLSENTTIKTDIGGAIDLEAGKRVEVLGSVIAPAGKIKVAINDGSKALQYDATQKIYIGDASALDVSGVGIVKPNTQGAILNNAVVNAGKIDISAQKGAVILKSGSVLKADGAAIQNDVETLSGYQRQTLHGDAGEIAVTARDAIIQDSTFSAKATGSGRNGTLSIGLEGKPPASQDEAAFPIDSRTIEVSQAKANQSASIEANSALDAQLAGKALISTEQINASGVDNVSLKASFGRDEALLDKVALQDGVNLQIKNNLTINAPLLEVANNGSAQMTAQHLAIKNENNLVDTVVPTYQALPTGAGKLKINARQVQIAGTAAIAGVNATNMALTHDLHGAGAIFTNGELNVAARQVYPDTGNPLVLQAFGDGSSIKINSNGSAAKPVLSAAGTLKIKADNITQAGVLTAPFGEIVLDAKNNLTLASGSTTSVASNGQIIPYGATRDAGDQYDTETKYVTISDKGLVDKKISLSGKKVDLADNAVIDLSAGGDMFAYEWIKGIGGSIDVLAQPNTYAVLPGLGREYAPNDKVYVGTSAAVGVGQTITIAGSTGLPAGEYTLLPARYALVPGAYMVQVESAANPVVGKVIPQIDGSSLVTGYRGDLATGSRSANLETFRITNGNIFRTPADQASKAPSQYLLTSATQFFANPDKTGGKDMSLPIDVARLSMAAQEQLKLDAKVVANRSAGGGGLQVDIDSSNIRVVSAAGVEDGTLQLTADSINKLNADSLLLGGQRNLENGTEKITTGASQVKIESNQNNEIKTSELLLTAKDEVEISGQSKITTGAAASKANKSALETNGAGAFFAVSANRELSYSRTGATSAETTGNLNVAGGASIQSGKSLVMDATAENKVEGDIGLQNGGVATIGAKRILLGEAPASYAGLKLDANTLSGLGQLSALALNSYGNIDTFGAVNLGNNQLNLTINAAGIAGHSANGESPPNPGAAPVTFVAKQFTLKNTQGATFEDVIDDAGRALAINADKVILAGAETAKANTKIDGFNAVNVNAKQVNLSGKGELQVDSAQATMDTALLKGDNKADFTFTATGKLTINNQNNLTSTDVESIGANIALQANQLDVNSHVAAKSGAIKLSAAQDLNIGGQALVDAGSTTVTFYNKQVSANAGSVELTSTNGKVAVASGAVVDVSGKNGANAGKVVVRATSAAGQGKLDLNGQFKGAAAADAKSGMLLVDVASLDNLAALNQKLDGFNESRVFRARTGDVLVDGTGNGALRAREIEVSADAGKLTVSGEINAAADKNAEVGLYARDNVVLTNTANIIAKSNAKGEKGGEVFIATKSGSLDLASGSQIDVSSGEGGAQGEILLRAPRNAANNDVNVAALGTTFKGTNQVKVEGVKTYPKTTVTNADQSLTALTGLYKEAEAFMQTVRSNPASFYSRLGIAPVGAVSVIPGLEIISNSTLAVSNDWSLHNWRFDTATGTGVTDTTQLSSGLNASGNELLAGNLTLRAAGGVSVNGTLSDGFGSAVIGANSTLPQGIQSWSYRIVAGADANAANFMATDSATAANVSLANGKGIRTGTGDIDIAASGDLVMDNNSSVIYTAGRNTGSLVGFDSPSNTLKPLYLSDGGDISVNVAGNIVGKEPNTGRQLVNNWLYRVGGGTGNLDTTWWVRPDLFNQSLATLGGGDVKLNAGKDISNFSASLPTNARFDTNGTTNNQSVLGGGDLTVSVGGNLNNGVYFVAKGEGDVNVGGAIQKQNTFGTTFALQDGKFDVTAKRDVFINSVFNPTLISHATANGQFTSTNGSSTFFNSYSPDASFSVSSLLGNALFESNPTIAGTSQLVTPQQVALNYYPSQVSVTAFDGSIQFGASGNGTVLMPSPKAQLDLLAKNDLTLNNITMSDADASIGTAKAPIAGANNAAQYSSSLLNPSPSLPFANNHNVNLLVAQEGSIQDGTAGKRVDLPKATTVYAGQDINNVEFTLQNNRADDISLIKAGKDIKIGTTTVAGPGNLMILAGRNVDLTTTGANIAATGNVTNPALPLQGASISLQAGLGKGANISGYISRYISPNGAGPEVLANDNAKLSAYRQATAEKLTSFMQKFTGNTTLSNEQAYQAFNTLSDDAKLLFLNQHLMTELIASGEGFAKSKNHDRGNNAIASLYPDESAGQISLFKSKLTTNSGGSVDLVAPHGLINVGVQGGSSDLGVITEKSGEIRAIAGTGFDVNQSKVITQFGSDISIWSTTGTIDAGRGSKTATSVPERFVSTDVDGNTTVEVRGVAEGSGIRAQSYDPDGPNGPQSEPKKGKVTLIAPVVDAGEAGIEAGDLVLIAPIVLNATNIQVQGSASGVPIAATTAVVGAGITSSPDAVNSAVSQVAQSVAQSASQAMIKPQLPSIISVDVISIGK